MRREYLLKIKINDRTFNRVLIDPHYERKHSATINDHLILRLVKLLDGNHFQPEQTQESGWNYFAVDPLSLDGKTYKLIWCSHPDELYIGIINAFRRPYGKISK